MPQFPVSLLVAGVTQQPLSPNEVFIEGSEGGSAEGAPGQSTQGAAFFFFKLNKFCRALVPRSQ